MDRVEVGGLDLSYERRGNGPPVVLLHGYVGDGASTWQPQLDGLSGDFTVIAWDAPGAGGSSDPPESFGMAGYADCLAGFIDALGLQHPHLLGLSFGGALALALQGRHPGAAASLVLASAYAGWAGSLSPEATAQRLEQSLALSALDGDALAAALLPTMFASAPSPDTEAAFRTSLAAFHPAGLRAMARASAEDLRPMLSGIDVPTLLVYGDRDARAPLEVAHALRAAIRPARLTVLEGCGHLVNLEAPDRFNREVGNFLQGASGRWMGA
jgi:pimeloyl-ACP methyl ester carboxylesterase